MTDVRLTALNPEDSQVYPVACNSSGELLVDKGDIGPDVDIEGDLSVGGSITAAGAIYVSELDESSSTSSGAIIGSGGSLYVQRVASAAATAKTIRSFHGTKLKFSVDAGGSASFAGDVTVASRSKQWMLVEQGGLCHMVEQTQSLIDEGFGVDTSVDTSVDYPKLRDVFNELDLVEKALSDVMERLRMSPPAGWPVWDGSNETE
jgi:hypothetical protein